MMIKRKIRYAINKNNFTNDYYASVLSREIELEEFLLYVKSALGDEQYSIFIEDLKTFFIEQLVAGNVINVFNIFTLQSKLKGSFTGFDDAFDPGRHYFELTVNTCDEFNNLFQNTSPKLKKTGTITR
ncbi:MAG: hypothetical protein ACOC2H_00755 [Spirochaetota bacterium]